ncbi:hypothetical protein OAO18_01720 [Francisellaceae bacterium]|nr:hypothetical protein [Francisellaceae bacterium]
MPISTQTVLDGQELLFELNSYDASTSVARSYAALSDTYTKPVQKTTWASNVYDPSSPKLKSVEDYVYYHDKNDPGYAQAEPKSVKDAMGNITEYEYYSQDVSKDNFQSIKRSETIRLNGYDKPITTNSSGLKWLDTSVEANGKHYTISKPYIEKVLDSIGAKTTKSEDIGIFTDPSHLLYGMPSSVIDNFDGNKPYVEQNVNASKTSGGGYMVSSSQTSLSTETDIVTPTSIQGSDKYFNAYGALTRIVDPVSGDITIYGDENGQNGYDALGRVKQITYLPSGHKDLKQSYSFAYGIDTKEGEAGYTLTTTTLLPGMKQGYQTKTYYDNEQHVTLTEREKKDHSGFYVTQENFYNKLGKTDYTISWYYDENGLKHPLETKLFYNEKQQVTAVQHPDGSTDVAISDDYHNRAIRYTLQPTDQIVSSDKNSLCFNPLASNGDNKQYTSCKVTGMSVSQRDLTNVGTTERPEWKMGNSYNYSIIMDPDFNYAVNNASTTTNTPLYSADVQSKIETLNESLRDGHAYDIKSLFNLADKIKSGCLDGQCQAAGFNTASYDAFDQPTESKDLISGSVTKSIYDEADPTQLNAQTSYIRNGQQAIRTEYYEYDDFGNVSKTYVAPGAYSETSQKTLVGEQSYSALGYLLNTSTLIGNENANKKVFFEYDKTTGLPTKMTDAQGNVITMHYDDANWKLKPSRVDYVAANPSSTAKNQSFYVTYSYTNIGDLSVIEKRELSANSLVSRTSFAYDADTLELTSTSITYDDGSTRTLLSDENEYYTPTENKYQADGTTKVTVSGKTNHLGLATETKYSGITTLTVGQTYNPDLSVSETKRNNTTSKKFGYDSVGRLSQVENYVNGAVLRKYSYLYNRLSQKALRTAQTEDTNKSEQRYDYTQLGQLYKMGCSGEECPADENGKPIRLNYYSYEDVFNKLTKVSHHLQDGTYSQVDYAYNNVDPTQATGIEYTRTENGETTTDRTIKLTYDVNGNVSHMHTDHPQQSKTEDQYFTYDVEQNLVQLKIDDSTIDYVYDASGLQIAEHYVDENGQARTLYQYYLGGLSEQKLNNESRYYVAGGSVHNGEYQEDLSDGFNNTGSVSNNTNQVKGNYVYTPFGGKRDIQQDKSLEQAQHLALSIQQTNKGYRTMNTDQVTGWQFLGDGYRAYNPELRIFMKHDSMSPLGAGGINAYSYSLNDPINLFDPSGHVASGDMGDVSDKQKKQYDVKQKQAELTSLMVAVIITSIVLSAIGGAVIGAIVGRIASASARLLLSIGGNFIIEAGLTFAGDRLILGKDYVKEHTAEYVLTGFGAGLIGGILGGITSTVKARRIANTKKISKLRRAANTITKPKIPKASVPQSSSRNSFKLRDEYRKSATYMEEAQGVKDMGREGKSFVVTDKSTIKLDSHVPYIYLVYQNRIKNSAPQIRVAKRIGNGSFRHHSTLAHFDKFNALKYQAKGIDKNIRVLMGGELIADNATNKLIISNKSGHFRPSSGAFENMQSDLKKVFGKDYTIHFRAN